MDDALYLRFEEKFRGSRQQIKDRVKVYLPIIEPLKTIYPEALAVDLGCGRGEWLELLKENGWQASGVDLNTSMVSTCKDLGLTATSGDAIKYLNMLKSDTVSVISGFHIAEHLPFELLYELIQEAHRILLPGGFLILETPNPENVMVSQINFYLDPTHRNPLPPALMQFLAEDAGFSKALIMRLNGSIEPDDNMPVSERMAWATGANPDYALVAQKTKTSNQEFLAYDSVQSEQALFSTMVINALRHYEYELNIEHTRLIDERNILQTQLAQTQAERDAIVADRQTVWAHRDAIQTQLNQVYNSPSYRITAPLRTFLSWVRVWRDRFNAKKKNSVKRVAMEISSRPLLRSIVMPVINLFPGYKTHIKNVVTGSESNSFASNSWSNNVNSLSRREQKIYYDLLKSIEQN